VRQRGATLVEVLFSLTIVLGGTLAMAQVLASSLSGSRSASRIDQAETRAQSILESLRLAPEAALACLEKNSDWSQCEKLCAACSFTVGPAPYRLEKAQLWHHGRVWDAQLTVGWGGGHAVTLRSGVFR
jgi:Tfp pilus assembly protein PilV